jgi:hypothetical protein
MQHEALLGMLIGAVSVIGGIAVAIIAIIISVPWSYRERLAKLEATSKERLAMIEKGYDPAAIFPDKKKAGNDPLFWGLLLMGLGAGFMLGYLLHLATGWSYGLMAHAMPIFLAGVCMIGYVAYRKRADRQNKG